MDLNKKYEKLYFILNADEDSLGQKESPTGYVKLENNMSNGRLMLSAQNVFEIASLPYNLYLLSIHENFIRYVDFGKLSLKNNRIDYKSDFNPFNLNNSNLSLSEINGVIIASIKPEGNRFKIYCPASAFKDKNRNYRELFIKAYTEKNVKPVQNEFIKLKDYIKRDDIATYTELSNKNTNIPKQAPEEPKHNTPQFNMFEKPLEVPKVKSTEERDVKKEEEPTNNNLNIGDNDFDQYQKMISQLSNDSLKVELSKDSARGICVVQKDSTNKDCAACEASGGGNGEKEFKCIERLTEIFDKCFEPYDPFKNKRQDYKWWKVGSPVQLNNILYQSDIRTPLLFNPALMMAQFKYRHILIGIYKSRQNKSEYLVCGVPSIYNVDERPYGEFCRWAQTDNNTQRHGAFGYWLVYIDINTGKLLGV